MIACMLLLSWQYLYQYLETFFLFLGLVILWALNSILQFQNVFITRGTCCDLVFGNIC